MTDKQPDHVVVVGAGLGGLRTIEALRTRGYQGQVTLVGDEQHPPYDRPPLSKQLLHGDWEKDRVTLRDHDGLAELGVKTHLGTRATALRGTTVELDDGGRLAADAVVIASGAAARTLPGQPAGVVTLRSLDDSLALRAALDRARSLLIVGGGFIGAEVAWAARRRDIAVTVLEALLAPCERVLGPAVGALAARLFTEAGVDLRCGAQVAAITGEHTVELADGTVLSADIVLVSIGAAPNLGWLADAGLLIRNGLACDGEGRALAADGTPAEGIWAVGDAAAWRDPGTGGHHRSEHWTTTVEQAARVAAGLLGGPPPAPAPPPYVWSDQFGLKVQVSGQTGGDDVRPLHGTGLDGGPVKGTVAGYYADGVLAGVVGFGAPGQFIRSRAAIGTQP